MTTKAQQTEQEAAREFLRERIQPGDTLYTILRHTSRSGMRRSVSVIQIAAPGVPLDWSGKVAAALGRRWMRDGDGGVVVDGAGMDMGFELVYSLSMALACAGSGPWWDAGRSTRSGSALTQRWL